jgi:histidinol-phosphatase (PHP family)
MQKFSLHTHTIGFDGHNSEEEMVARASDLGWDLIGFSNHFIVYPTIKQAPMYEHASKGGYADIYSSSFDEAISKFEPHYRKIDELRQNSGFKILKGMEVDFFANQEWIEGFQKAINHLKPDYLIGAAHFIENNNILYNSHDVKRSSPIEQNKFLCRYWQNERAAIQSGLFTFMAHLDLMKKVGLGQEENWAEEEKKTILEAKQAGIMIELNTSYYKFGNEPYPSTRIMQMLAAENIPVLISDDAHSVTQLGNHFEEASVLAKQSGITNFYKKNSERNNITLNLTPNRSNIDR